MQRKVTKKEGSDLSPASRKLNNKRTDGLVGIAIRSIITVLFFLLVLSYFQSKSPAKKPVESSDYFVVVNGKVRTVDDAHPLIEAFAVKDGVFIDVGSSQDILTNHPKAKKIDVQGNAILPGLIDSHVHLMGQGRLMLQVDLTGSKSIQEVISRIHEYMKKTPVPKGWWILGQGWDQNIWEQKNFPKKEDLDLDFPTIPIYLKRVDYHAAWCNSAALDALPDTLPAEDPEGGSIFRDEKGEPTGVFIDNAMWIIEKAIPEYEDKTLEEALWMAIRACNQFGITSVHDAGISKDQIQFFKKAIDENRFTIRNYGFLACDNGVYFCPEVSPIFENYGNKLTVRSVKVFLDGALGSWGAAMIDPYSDKPNVTGLLRMPAEELEPAVRKWVNAGYQVNTHAIGDLANRLAINAYEKVINEVGLDKDLRLRIEHAQIIALSDLNRLAPLKIIPSFQPTHATSDMSYAEDRLGPSRIKGAYAWKTLLDSGTRLPFSSDFPVEKVSPFLGIYAAVTRQDLSGNPKGGWYPEQRVSIHQAVKGFTIEAAYASFNENRLGSISKGKWADFIIIDRDIYEVEDARDIARTRVISTYLGGNLIFGEDFSKAH